MSKKSYRRPRQWIERGIFRDGERFGISYAARFDSGAVKRKRVLLDPSVRTLGAARKALRAALTDTERGRLVHKALAAPPFREFADEYLRSREREIASIRRARIAVNAACEVFRDVPIDKVEPWHVERFKTQRLATCRPGTVKRDLAVLHTLFRAAVRVYKVRADNPCSDVRIGRYQEAVRRVLTLDEQRRLLEAASPHLQPFIVVALETGMRLSELSRLQWQDIDFSTDTITIPRTKSREVQTVPLRKRARDALLALRAAGRIGPVFTFQGSHLENPKKALAGAARRAGIGNVTCHVFRHTCATMLLRDGVDVRTVQRWLRHASLSTTERYLRPEQLSAVARALDAKSGPQVAPPAESDAGENVVSS